MKANIPDDGRPRLVIVGGGFAGLKLAKRMLKSSFRIVLLDKNNFHQFQPLLYQVATSGLEPSSIAFPFRKVFQKENNVNIRVGELLKVDPENKRIETTIGIIRYDYLVLATGVETNFFGKGLIATNAMPMKSVNEALGLRNRILQNFETALTETNPERRKRLMNIVVVGGGPTGVEISGALAEMKRFILPKDYPELDFNEMNIYLLEASGKLLNGMSDQASASALKFLGQLGVNVNLNTAVEDFDGETVSLNNQNNLITSTLIWAAGVAPKKIPGLPETVFTRNHRIKTDSFNRIEGFSNIFALGDLAYQTEDKFPNGHPQLAQVGLQQASNLAKNLQFILSDPENTMVMKPFHYRDLGSMATVGKNMAVADFSFIRFQGFFAWLIWLFVHLMAILGVKNRIFIFLNWCWSYLTYDQSLRIILRNKEK